jgi:hypothetical protein
VQLLLLFILSIPLLPNSTPGQAKSFEVGDSVLVAWKYEAGIFLNEE